LEKGIVDTAQTARMRFLVMTKTKPSWIHKVAEWYRTLSHEDSEGYFVHSVIKGTLTLIVAVPFIKILEAFVFYSNSILQIPSQPLWIVNRPVTEVVVNLSDLAIVITYLTTVLFGFLNLVVKEGKKLFNQIRDKQ
jgi:hypothetical protein